MPLGVVALNQFLHLFQFRAMFNSMAFSSFMPERAIKYIDKTNSYCNLRSGAFQKLLRL